MKNTKWIILIIILVIFAGCAKDNTSLKPQQNPKETIIPSPEASAKPDINREKSVVEIEELLRAAYWEKTDVNYVWYNTFCGDSCGERYIDFGYHLNLEKGEFYRHDKDENSIRRRSSYYWNEDVSQFSECQYNGKTKAFSENCKDYEEYEKNSIESQKRYFVDILKDIGITVYDLNKLVEEE